MSSKSLIEWRNSGVHKVIASELEKVLESHINNRFKEPGFPFDKFLISKEELRYRFKTRHPKTDKILTKAIENISYGQNNK